MKNEANFNITCSCSFVFPTTPPAPAVPPTAAAGGFVFKDQRYGGFIAMESVATDTNMKKEPVRVLSKRSLEIAVTFLSLMRLNKYNSK